MVNLISDSDFQEHNERHHCRNMEDLNNGGFGVHVIIDVSNITDRVSRALLVDSGAVESLFTAIVNDAGMVAVGRMQVFHFPPRLSSAVSESICFEEVDGGLTAFQVLAESHLSIHTFPAIGSFSLDLFSCRPFDADKITTRVQSMIGRGSIMKSVVLQRRFSRPVSISGGGVFVSEGGD
jgi:S-adenosylmethionine/arginine decarboxylase-like enzyme